jgi:hypothetical protein
MWRCMRRSVMIKLKLVYYHKHSDNRVYLKVSFILKSTVSSPLCVLNSHGNVKSTVEHNKFYDVIILFRQQLFKPLNGHN